MNTRLLFVLLFITFKSYSMPIVTPSMFRLNSTHFSKEMTTEEIKELEYKALIDKEYKIISDNFLNKADCAFVGEFRKYILNKYKDKLNPPISYLSMNLRCKILGFKYIYNVSYFLDDLDESLSARVSVRDKMIDPQVYRKVILSNKFLERKKKLEESYQVECQPLKGDSWITNWGNYRASIALYCINDTTNDEVLFDVVVNKKGKIKSIN